MDLWDPSERVAVATSNAQRYLEIADAARDRAAVDNDAHAWMEAARTADAYGDVTADPDLARSYRAAAREYRRAARELEARS